VFKRAIQRLADTLGIEVRIAHYPSYTSKWNPIEHRLFPHITRKLKGVILKSVETVKRLIETTIRNNTLSFIPVEVRDSQSKTGLRVSLPNGIILSGIDEQNVALLKTIVQTL